MYLLNGHYKVEIILYLLKKGNLNLMIKKNHYHRTNTISSIRLISIKKKKNARDTPNSIQIHNMLKCHLMISVPNFLFLLASTCSGCVSVEI